MSASHSTRIFSLRNFRPLWGYKAILLILTIGWICALFDKSSSVREMAFLKELLPEGTLIIPSSVLEDWIKFIIGEVGNSLLLIVTLFILARAIMATSHAELEALISGIQGLMVAHIVLAAAMIAAVAGNSLGLPASEVKVAIEALLVWASPALTWFAVHGLRSFIQAGAARAARNHP